jgi:hypothetical protein
MQQHGLTGGAASAAAAGFLWLGMVLAISFLEAPLKFRAPGVDLRIGLGIGRLVFRALNAVEVVLALWLVSAVLLGEVPDRVAWAAFAPVLVLVVQLAGVRPLLTRRSDRVLAGADGGGSRAHLLYIGAEVIKAVALIVVGVLSLQG